ncbi:type I-E CRISPR-associated endonuclease Cas1e [Fundidesulfovibrio putealis]|uniref:type I-E CRISPR-associated endonuclease Cas1e n=1 Tax=Fundidesulfovibrio putealis TaxID=270496 RepID=UPI00041B4B57|nr:type I-E CRISPR-associated endonuclease Cas1e [Fundidesulfovibrio putealis]
MSRPFTRLGLASARIPQADRHGLLWLYRGNLTVEAGTLRFTTAGIEGLAAGSYDIPYQTVSVLLLGPGTTVSHDVFRLAASHGTSLVAVGQDGVRLYTAHPAGPDHSRLARLHASLWSDPIKRLDVARRLYAWRLNEVLPTKDISALRGIEGARMRETYKLAARRFQVEWHGRRFDREAPESTDIPNQAINHAAVAVGAAADIAVAATATIPQLGFIHEGSSRAFALDIADLYRDDFTLPIAFESVHIFNKQDQDNIERVVRRRAGEVMRKKELVASMIDRIKALIDEHDGHNHA